MRLSKEEKKLARRHRCLKRELRLTVDAMAQIKDQLLRSPSNPELRRRIVQLTNRLIKIEQRLDSIERQQLAARYPTLPVSV